MPFGSGLTFAPSFTYQPVNMVKTVLEGTQDKFVVEMGAGGRRLAPWVKTVDMLALPETDYVCDFVTGQTPFDAGSVDLVIATGVLEHVDNEVLFIREVHRILKTGGIVHIELPFLQQYHEDPIDCRRYTMPGLVRFLQQHGFESIKSGAHIGPTVTVLTLTSYYVDLLFGGSSTVGKILGNAAFVTFSIVFWPLRFLDKWLIDRPKAHRLAFGVYCTARKR